MTVMLNLLPLNAMQAAADVLWSPIPRRHPRIKIALSEGGIGWVPYFLERADFTYDAESDVYTCPGGKELKQSRRTFTKPREKKPDEDGMLRYRAGKADCDACELKARCCPKEPSRKILRSIFELSRDRARAIAQTTDYAISCKLRKKVEILFAHLKRILGLNRLRLRGPCGARDEFHLAATAQNLRKLAKLLPVPQVAR